MGQSGALWGKEGHCGAFVGQSGELWGFWEACSIAPNWPKYEGITVKL